MKLKYNKLRPKKIIYRPLKDMNLDVYMNDIQKGLSKIPIGDFSAFNNVINYVTDQHAPTKTKLVRGNDKPFMTKQFRKEIMKRTRLKNKALISGNANDWTTYKKQRNLCSKLNYKTKCEFYSCLDISNIDNNKKFWRTFKPLLADKYDPGGGKIVLVENDTIISDDTIIANMFNEHFVNITRSLNLKDCGGFSENSPGTDFVEVVKDKFKHHPSILKIKTKMVNAGNNKVFEFSNITPQQVSDQIRVLRINKSSRGDIPIKIIKIISKVCIISLTDCINSAINNATFPDDLKLGEIIPIFKNDDTTSKSNYRPITLLSVISKIYERLLSEQINVFIADKISIDLCGFRKGYSTQHALIKLIEKWRAFLDKKGIIGAILMDLSKAYDCLPTELLIAKLEAYGFGNNSLKLMHSYLTNRCQRVKIGSAFSTWADVIRGVPQGSVLGPILFNIFINDLLYFTTDTDICNFADDNTIYACDYDVSNVIMKLENDLKTVLNWFKSNSMVANPKKFQFIILGYNSKFTLCVGDLKVACSDTVILLGITIDKSLKFNQHIDKFCKKARAKASALTRIIPKLRDAKKAKLLTNSFFFSLFRYCPIIWMLCSKRMNNIINQLHKRILKTLYQLQNKTFDELLSIDGSHCIHVQNLQCLMTEIYKTIHNLNPPFMKEIFQLKNTDYELRDTLLLTIPTIKTQSFGRKSVSFMGAIMWNKLPLKIKISENLSTFKTLIKQWDARTCTCNICR